MRLEEEAFGKMSSICVTWSLRHPNVQQEAGCVRLKFRVSLKWRWRFKTEEVIAESVS